jgi:membrane peptidoglycan carboxypeptidase
VLLAELKGESREWISLEKLKVTRWRNKKAERVPGRLMEATLSIEDARFYHHPGMDAKRIAGAALANFRQNKAVQGGSTILSS